MEGKKFESIITKVCPHTYRIIKRIEKHKGISNYLFLQMALDTFARYTDDRHNLSPEMERVMSMFEKMDGWADALNLADPTVDKVVGEAIYFLYDGEGKKHGVRAVHITKPFFGNWTEDVNILHIVERVFKLLLPELYKRMVQESTELGYDNIVEFIRYLIMEYTKDRDSEAIRKEFEDNARGDFGQERHEGGPYKRHPAKHAESQEFNFNEQ